MRLGDFLAEEDATWAQRTGALIVGAIKILERHPLIGRPVPDTAMHELAISRGRTGYLALYQYDDSLDIVIVNAIRHQREAGFEQ